VPTHFDTEPGGTPGPHRPELERRALAYGLIEQTARRLRTAIDIQLAESGSARASAMSKCVLAGSAAHEIAHSIATRTSWTPSEAEDFAKAMVCADVDALYALDGLSAPSPAVETGSAAL
jgi:hypothetical protein